MQTAKKQMLFVLATITAILFVVPRAVFGQTATSGSNVAGIPLAAVAGIIGLCVGAAANTIRGWWNAPDDQKYSIKKLLGALLLAIVQTPIAYGYANMLTATGNLDPIIAFTTMFMQGFTIDVAHTATKN